MNPDIIQKLNDPFVWVAVIAILFNILLYSINRRTFKILYEKPRFKIKGIQITPATQDKMGAPIAGSRITVDVFNPSSFDNIISFSIFRIPFRSMLIHRVEYLPLRKSDKELFILNLNHEEAEKYKGKFFVLTLTDLKRKKTRKIFRLTER